EAALRITQEARERLANYDETEAAELTRERALVDEYISVRLLEMLAGAGRALAGLAQSRSTNAARLQPVVAAVEERVGEVLSAELAYREAHGITNADPTSPEAL